MFPLFTHWNHLNFNLQMISEEKNVAIIWQINQFKIIHFLMLPFYSPWNYKKIDGFSLFQGI